MLVLALAAILLAAPPDAPPARNGPLSPALRDTAPPAPVAPAEAYAVAVARLLERVTGARTRVLLLPTLAGEDVAVRARRASGPPIAATEATARAVARLLVRRGYTTAASARLLVAPTGDALQLVLGELRYEPAAAPRFARLKIAVVGTDSTRATADFLLRREAAGWRAINMRTSGLTPRVR